MELESSIERSRLQWVALALEISAYACIGTTSPSSHEIHETKMRCWGSTTRRISTIERAVVI